MAHKIVHVELSSSDNVAAGKFYAALFGWKITQMPEMGYAMFEDGTCGGGFSPVSEQNPAGMVTVYISTEDIPGTLAQAAALGGTIIMPEMEVTGMGWMGLFRDPTGNVMGLWKELPRADG